MRARNALLIAGAVLVGVISAAAAGELAVKVTVAEPAGIARRAEPAVGGVPFKKGQVKDVSELALFTKGGQPVPAQFSRLAGYEDGSVQWALVDVPVNLPAGGKAEFVVKKGRAVPPGKPLVIRETGNTMTVDTGSAKFTVDRTKLSLLESVELGGKKVAGPGSAQLIDPAGKVFKAGRPSKVSWEYKGPVRATLRLDGSYVDGTGKAFIFYTTRLTFFVGLSTVRVKHSLRNSLATAGFDAKIKEATLSLKLAVKGAEQGKGPNWAAVGDGKAGLLLAQRHAGGCFPGASTYRRARSKTLYKQSLSGGEATVFAVPPGNTPPTGGGRTLYGYDAAGKFFVLGDCAHKDTEMWLDFYAGARTAAANDSRQKALRSWLHALADPVWISETETMGYGKFGTLADEVATYKKWGWKGWDDESKHPKMPHQPDACVPYEQVHYESEADSAECLLLMYLRTGQRGYLDWGRAWAEFGKTHYAYRTDGFEYQGHTKRGRKGSKGLTISWRGPKKYGWLDSRSEYCHFYGRGIFDYYCLTGDVDALEAGRDLVEQVAAWGGRKKPGVAIGYWGCRGFARIWLGALRLAQLTREPKDRALADHMAKVVQKAKDWDPRGFIYWGSGPGYVATKNLAPDLLPPKLKEYMKKNGIKISKKGVVTAKDGSSWTVRSDGGTWQQVTMQSAMERYWRLSGSEVFKKRAVQMADFGRKYQISKKCQQAFYYTTLDFPEKNRVYDPGEWLDSHKNCPGPGAKHSGHYTRFFAGTFARAYSLTGDKEWLKWAKLAWNRGSKRGYQAVKPSAADDEVYRYAWHNAPKDDAVLSTARMFYEVPRAK